MRNGSIRVLACLLLVTTSGRSQDQPGAKGPGVVVVALDLVKPPPPEVIKQAFQQADSVSTFMRGGLKLRLLLTVPDRVIVDLDAKGVEVGNYADDVAGELSATAVASLRSRDSSMEGGPISSDRHHALIELAMKTLPTKGAKVVKLKGKVKVNVGSDEKTTELKALDLKPGSELAAGPVRLKVKSARAFGNGRSGTFLSLDIDAVRGRVKSVAFYDEAGGEIESTMHQDRDYGDRDRDRGISFSLLKRDLQTVKAKVTYYDKVDEMTVPFSLEAGLGI